MATSAPPWAGYKRAAQVNSPTDDVAGRSQLADDAAVSAHAGVAGIRDEAGGPGAADQGSDLPMQHLMGVGFT